jgi:predicted transcriptional regulator
METRNITIRIEPLEQGLRRFAEVYGKLKRGEHVYPSRILAFADMETFRKFLTPARLQLLHVVRKQQPKSIYALAGLLERDIKSVNTDIKLLRDLGLIKLSKKETGRAQVIPKVPFDRMNVEIALV